MNLLFSLDENYIPPLKVLLKSIFLNHPNETFDIYIMYSSINVQQLDDLTKYIKSHGSYAHPIIANDFFDVDSKKHITRYYTLDMYSWLFAPYILSDHVERILYLDPDIINMNDFSEFYNKSFEGHSFIATNYKFKTVWFQPFNNIRLKKEIDSDEYFNSGVVLMNLKKLRRIGSSDDIVQSIQKNKNLLILPDQDIFNALYDQDIMKASWKKYNMDPKVFDKLEKIKPSKYNLSWAQENVTFIHFNGKHKPWEERGTYKYSLGRYYFAYEKERDLADDHMMENIK